MTREEKYLLIKDLCARVPYGVKAEVPNHINPLQILGIETLCKGTWAWRKGTYLVSFWNDVRPIENIKPYLRPMSSMTEEEKKAFDKFVCIDEFAWNGDAEKGYPNQASIMSDGIGWLLSHHFDFRGLIEKGLALESPKDMYKED